MNLRWGVLGWVLLCGLGATACLFDPNLSRFERCGTGNTCRSGYTCLQSEGVCLPDCGLQAICAIEEPPPGDEPDGGTPPDSGLPTDGGQTPDGGENSDAGTDGGPPTVQPLRWITASLNLVTEETPFSQQLFAEGGVPPYQFQSPATLPQGFKLKQNLLEADKQPAGTFQVLLEVKDSATPPSTAQQTFSLVVQPLLRMAGPLKLVNGYSGTAYAERVYATGGTPPYLFTLDSGSTLPSPLTLQGTGSINGSPSTTGLRSFRVRVTDSGTPPQTTVRDLSVDIGTPNLITEISTQSLPDGRVGTRYTYVLKASNGSSPTWTVKGSLPSGIQLNSATGTLDGTPELAGKSSFTLSAGGLLTPDQAVELTVY
jgi:hypothetical protein